MFPKKKMVFFAVLVLVVAFGTSISTLEINGEVVENSDKFTSTVLLECSDMNCVKDHLLSYLDSLLNIVELPEESSSARLSTNIDQTIFKRLSMLSRTHNFEIQLPELIFDGAKLTYNARHGLDISEPTFQGRGILKKKLLVTLLLLFKLKMKLLMPIFVAIIGIKAVKALVISKLTFLILTGFLVSQFVKKSGLSLMMPSLAMSSPVNDHPVPSYGVPMSSYGVPLSSYGVPNAAAQPANSYEPAAVSNWDSSSPSAAQMSHPGPYSRIWSESIDETNNAPYSAYVSSNSDNSSS